MDSRPFIEHWSLATRWLRLKGRSVTDLAVVRVMARHTADDLRDLLAQ